MPNSSPAARGSAAHGDSLVPSATSRRLCVRGWMTSAAVWRKVMMPSFVAMQVEILQKRCNDALGDGHAIVGAHRGTGIHDHHQSEAGLAGTFAQAQVIPAHLERSVGPANP